MRTLKRTISALLILALLLSLSACGGAGSTGEASVGSKTSGTADSKDDNVPKPAQSTVMSPENTSAVLNGVTVDVGEYVLASEAELSVTKEPSEDHSEDGYKIDVYDIKLGDLHELDDYITIRIPYDATYCEKGQDPAKCVGAKYKNEETGEWEDVLFEVDAEKQELVIYTDHLSEYGALTAENAGRRDALVTEVLYSPLSMSTDETIDFARKIAEDEPGVYAELAEYAANACDKIFDYADRLDNAINIATLGNVPEWLDTSIPDTNLSMFSALGYLATATNLMKITVQDSFGGGASKADVLNLIRDVAMKTTTYWADAFSSFGSGALSVGMGGVLIIDKWLTAFAEEAKSIKMEDITYVYHHYNEGFSANWAHKLMTPMDWRKMVIELIEKNPNDPDAAIKALEEGFRDYASDFFKLSPDKQAEVASDVPNVTIKRIPEFTKAEEEQMINDYVAYLKDRFMPAILKSVQTYFVLKNEEAELAAINKIRNYYNTNITITIQEDLPNGAKSAYTDYIIRFAPLDETAEKKNWTGKWPESGKITTSSTLIGFMTSGYPHTVEFFKSGANLDTDKPEFTIPFVITMPSITITLNRPVDWVDPYEYFNVQDISELYPKLSSSGAQMLEVTPVAYDNEDNSQIALSSGTESFMIDLTKGAVTTYSATYEKWNAVYSITYTFTAIGTSELLRVSVTSTETSKFGVETNSSDDCMIYHYNVEDEPEFAKKGLIIDNFTPGTISFIINRAQISK